MDRFFSFDSPVMRFLTKTADLIILNVLTMLCCLPVITAGASFAAMHYVLLQLVRGEESYIIRTFFAQFKANFLKATALWIFFLVLFAGIGAGFFLILRGGGSTLVLVGEGVLGLVIFMLFLWAFPLQAKFENTLGGTLKNAYMLAFLKLHYTIAMVLVTVTVTALWVAARRFIFLGFMLGMTLPAYLCARMYNVVFKEYEETVEEAEGAELADGTDGTEDALAEGSGTDIGSMEIASEGAEAGEGAESGEGADAGDGGDGE